MMTYKKKCPECGQVSYYYKKEGFWTCSYCAGKIDEVEAEVAGNEKN